MNSFVVTASSVPTIANGNLNIVGLFGGGKSAFDYKFIEKGSFAVAYAAGTAQVSTVTVSGTLTAGNTFSFSLAQDLSNLNNNLPDEYSQIISYTFKAGDTVTTVAAALAVMVNTLPFEIVATSLAGVLTLTATLPYSVFAIAEVLDQGANIVVATGTPGAAKTGKTGVELIAQEITGAVSGTNYGEALIKYKGLDYMFYFTTAGNVATLLDILQADLAGSTFNQYIAVI